jgi:hypothetical protein
LVAFLVVLTSTLAFAQDPTASDIQRLQDAVTDAGRSIADLRGRDATAARNLQGELNELQDEVIYLKVRLRKERSVPHADYVDVRDRLESLKTRARSEDGAGRYSTPPSAAPAAPVAPAAPAAPAAPVAPVAPVGSVFIIPVATELDVRLQTPINSGTANVEDVFEATTLVDLKDRDGRVIIPAGSLARGIITAVKAAGRVERKGSVSLTFQKITVRGTTYPIRATLTQAVESEGLKGEAARVGTGAAVGGILGGILGGVKGTIAGILLGGGGTMVATEGQQVDLQPGTVLRMRFDSELAVAGS